MNKENNIITLDINSLVKEVNKEGKDWILNGLRRGGVGFIIAPPDSGKGYLCLSIAYELATGINLIGVIAEEQDQLKTLYWPIEDGTENTAARILKHLDDMNEQSRLLCQKNINLYASQNSIACSNKLINTEMYNLALNEKNKLIKAAQHYDLLIIDTMREAMGSADEVIDDSLINILLKEIADRAGVAILAIHHPTKAVARGTETVNSVSASGLSQTIANSRVNLYIQNKTKGVGSYLQHIKANFVSNENKINKASIFWSDASLPYLHENELKKLNYSSIHDQFETKRIDTSVVKQLEPKVINPDDILLSEESKRMALQKIEDEKVINDDLIEQLKRHRKKKNFEN